MPYPSRYRHALPGSSSLTPSTTRPSAEFRSLITFQTGHPYYFPPFTKPIWGHMDYMQLISLLAKQALPFARASTLPATARPGSSMWGRRRWRGRVRPPLHPPARPGDGVVVARWARAGCHAPVRLCHALRNGRSGRAGAQGLGAAVPAEPCRGGYTRGRRRAALRRLHGSIRPRSTFFAPTTSPRWSSSRIRTSSSSRATTTSRRLATTSPALRPCNKDGALATRCRAARSRASTCWLEGMYKPSWIS